MRRLLGRSVCSLVLLGAVPALGAAQASDSAVARMIDVDGHAVRVLTRGLERRAPGDPLVIFEAGAMNPLEVWSLVLPLVPGGTALLAYDRAGLGQSEWDGETPTPRHANERLHRLLDTIGAEPPYVLVGFSWGGVLMRYFAGAHPDEVAGLVFVDPGPIVTQTRAEMLAPFDSVGAGRAGYDAMWDGYAALFRAAPPAVRAEFEVFVDLMELAPEARGLRPVPDVPTVVLVSGKYLPPPPGPKLPYDPLAYHEFEVRHRASMLREWALASSEGMLVLANHVTHVIPREDPALVTWAIERVLAAVKR